MCRQEMEAKTLSPDSLLHTKAPLSFLPVFMQFASQQFFWIYEVCLDRCPQEKVHNGSKGRSLDTI
jgi:hypothetical protein